MTPETTRSSGADLTGIDPRRLFLGSCLSLIATSVGFAVVAASLFPLKAAFGLANKDVGWIAGASLGGCTVSMLVLGSLCDALGMKRVLRVALVCHLAGPLLMISATGPAAFWMLFGGALILALGNGAVQAACNPLVTTIYPDRKTEKLAHFHLWFPGGILIGAVLSFLFDKAGAPFWQLKLGLILVPTVIYGLLFTGQKFPVTERVQSGISFGEMLRETFYRPLFLILLLCMMITASLELAPGAWIPAVLRAGGIPGILVLAYINGLMAVLRSFAGAVGRALSNASILLISAAVAGIGLTMLSYSTSTWFAFLSATVFAVGVCYFWPMMIGTTAERVTKGGPLALAVMGATGMLAAGLIAPPAMGYIADGYLHERLVENEQKTVAALDEVAITYAPLVPAPPEGVASRDMQGAVESVKDALAGYGRDGKLPEGKTAGALRAAVDSGPPDDASGPLGKPAAQARRRAAALLHEADNHGGLMSFRYVAPLSLVVVVIFGILCIRDRSKDLHKPAAAADAREAPGEAPAGQEAAAEEPPEGGAEGEPEAGRDETP